MSAELQPKRVIWITTDHMRYDCIGANDNPTIYTPNLDFLASHGVNFDNCFAQNPLCMPSRASFMTGLYPQQTGVTHNGYCLPPDFEPVIAKCFKAGDYSTTQIGKLHLQPHEDNDLAPRERYNYGFDKFYLAEEPGAYDNAYMKWLVSEYPDLAETFRIQRPLNPERNSCETLKIIDAPWQASFSGWIAEQTKRCIGGFGGNKKLVRDFIHMGFYAPHPPLNPTWEMFVPYKNASVKEPRFQKSDERVDKPAPLVGILNRYREWTHKKHLDYRKHFYAMVTGVDMAIGEVINYIKQRGELDDTLIIFSSDHGDMCGDHNSCNKHSSFYDEIMHLPLILHWPNGFGTRARRIPAMVEMVDILPTILGLCGITAPQVMSGNDYSNELLNGADIKGRENVMAFHYPNTIMLRNKKYKYIRYSEDEEVLYDLEDDPGETTNCAQNSRYRDNLNCMRNKSLSRLAAASKSHLPRYYEM